MDQVVVFRVERLRTCWSYGGKGLEDNDDRYQAVMYVTQCLTHLAINFIQGRMPLHGQHQATPESDINEPSVG